MELMLNDDSLVTEKVFATCWEHFDFVPFNLLSLDKQVKAIDCHDLLKLCAMERRIQSNQKKVYYAILKFTVILTFVNLILFYRA